MSEELELSRKLADEGDYKKALQSLWKVEQTARGDPVEAEGLLEVASMLREKTSGRQRDECDLLVGYAQRYLSTPAPVVTSADPATSTVSKEQAGRAALFLLCCALLTSGAAVYCAWAMPCTGGIADDSPYANAALVFTIVASLLWMLTVLAVAASAIGADTPGCGSAIAYLFAILLAVVVVLPFSGIVLWAFTDVLC